MLARHAQRVLVLDESSTPAPLPVIHDAAHRVEVRRVAAPAQGIRKRERREDPQPTGEHEQTSTAGEQRVGWKPPGAPDRERGWDHARRDGQPGGAAARENERRRDDADRERTEQGAPTPPRGERAERDEG